MNIRKHAKGVYRFTINDEHFMQLIKGRWYGGNSLGKFQEKFVRDNTGRYWQAEIRRTETGDLIRYAGIWPSRKQAIESLTETD